MITTSTASSLLNLLCGNQYYFNINGQCYIGLLSAEPATDGTISSGDEPFGYGNYARVLLGKTYSSGSGNVTKTMYVTTDETTNKAIATNSTVADEGKSGYIMFPEAKDSAYPKPITHFGLFSAATGGKPYLFGELLDEEGVATTITVAQGTVPLIRPEQLKITLQ